MTKIEYNHLISTLLPFTQATMDVTSSSLAAGRSWGQASRPVCPGTRFRCLRGSSPLCQSPLPVPASYARPSRTPGTWSTWAVGVHRPCSLIVLGVRSVVMTGMFFVNILLLVRNHNNDSTDLTVTHMGNEYMI